MPQVFDFQAAGPILKQRYESDPVLNGFAEDHAFLADVPKDESSDGAAFQIAVKSAFMSTRNVTVPGALSSGGPDKYVAFNVLNVYNDYAVAQLSGPAIDAARSNEGAMIKVLTEALDGAYASAYESQARQLMGNGGGSRGQITNSTFATQVATLSNTGDALRFWEGQVIQVSSDDGSNGSSNAGLRTGSLTVSGVDYQAGTVTFSANMSTGVAAIAQNDYLFMSGDYGAGFLGLGAWNPVTAPTSALFLGVDRTRNIVGLSGWRINGKGQAYENTLTTLFARMNSMGARPDRCYLNPIDWAQFSNTQNNKVIIDKGKTPSMSTPELSFESLTMATAKGPINIIADIDIPQGYARACELKHLTLRSNGKICRPSNNWIGNMWLPSYTDDIFQARLVSRSFLVCREPKSLGVAQF
jgi:hypothetical protein